MTCASVALRCLTAGSTGTRISTSRKSQQCRRSGSRPRGAGAASRSWRQAACWSAQCCCALDAEPAAGVQLPTSYLSEQGPVALFVAHWGPDRTPLWLTPLLC